MSPDLLKGIIEKALNVSGFNMDEIGGGMSKQVYKITTQADSFILYIWRRPYDNRLTENQTRGIEYLFPDGFKYFVHNSKLLSDLGIRVPYILTAGRHDEGGFDYAIVECFKGQSMADYMGSGGNMAAAADKITAVMDRMAAEKRAFYGPPKESEPNDISAVQLVFNFTAEELNIASKLDNEVSALRPAVLQLMQKKMSEIDERKTREFSLIHGELTPPHVFMLEDGEIGLIDVEGVKYFDVEFDWAVVDFAYGGTIPLPKSLDAEKFEFYKLCWKIVNVSAAVDYLVHVDGNHQWFKNTRQDILRDLKVML